MNKSILLGRLTKEPEIRYSQANNTKVTNFTLAVNRNYAKIGEERQADFINIVAFSKLADFAEKYLKKGLQICVCGRIQTRVYTDSDNQKHYITEIIAENIDFADSQQKINEEINEDTNKEIVQESNLQNSHQISEEMEDVEDDFPF